MSYAKKFSDNLKEELNKVDGDDAKDFLFEYGYDCSSFRTPEYYSISGFKDMNLDSVNDWNELPVANSFDVFTPKRPMEWRRFSFFHPFIYWHLVNLITEEDNWQEIKDHLCRDSCVANYTVPKFEIDDSNSSLQGQNILLYLRLVEKDLIKDSDNYEYVGQADIQNFYSSIYTHSIGWALHSREDQKKDYGKFEKLGNKIDKLLQNSKNRQTNGIPTGSMVSDIIAEIILSEVDVKLDGFLSNNKELKSRVLIARFRDDYKILGKSESDIKKVLKNLSWILSKEFDLSLNHQKTSVKKGIVDNVMREWSFNIRSNHLLRDVRLNEFPDEIDFNFIKDLLLEAYKIQSDYIYGRPAHTILMRLAQKLDSIESLELESKDIPELISILRKLMKIREELTPIVFYLIDNFLSHSNEDVSEKILESISNSIIDEMDEVYQSIWLYRLCCGEDSNKCDEILEKFSNPMIKVLDDSNFLFGDDENSMFKVSLGELSENDKEEMDKFNFIDNDTLENSQNNDVDLESINPIKSY